MPTSREATGASSKLRLHSQLRFHADHHIIIVRRIGWRERCAQTRRAHRKPTMTSGNVCAHVCCCGGSKRLYNDHIHTHRQTFMILVENVIAFLTPSMSLWLSITSVTLNIFFFLRVSVCNLAIAEQMDRLTMQYTQKNTPLSTPDLTQNAFKCK